MPLEYLRAQHRSIRDLGLTEAWVHARIAEDREMLGLGKLILHTPERSQPGRGRLDMLLTDPESDRRYEVEIQLGETDPSHIIRTLEYWDIERKRYPQYDHIAVIVAEDITSRFLNVVSLFNGFIPLVAIKMTAMLVGSNITLTFTRVLDQVALGTVEEDEEGQEPTDRGYWEKKVPISMLGIADDIERILQTQDPALRLRYRKHYIGVAKDGQGNNVVSLSPKLHFVRLKVWIDRSTELDEKLSAAGVEATYDPAKGQYKFELSAGDSKKHEGILRDVLTSAYRAFIS